MEIWLFKENKGIQIPNLVEIPLEGFIWIDCRPDQIVDVINLIQKVTGFTIHQHHVKDCLNPHHPCFYDTTQAYDVLIFRSLDVADHHRPTKTKPVTFLIFNNLLITCNQHDPAIDRVKCRFLDTQKQLPNSPITLAFILLDEIADNFLGLRTPLIDKFNHWQQELFATTKQGFDWKAFLDFKSEVRKLRTLGEDQQEVIYQWHQANELGLAESVSIFYHDLSDHIDRIIAFTTQLESDLDTLIQIHYSLIGNRTNDVMRMLTVISAIFLPLNLIAGIFGMNFANMHLLQIENGANLAISSMALLGIGLFLLFKWKKWI